MEWCLAVVFLTLGATLLFCVALHGPLQPDLCHRLQDLIRNTAKPLIDLFGGWGE